MSSLRSSSLPSPSSLYYALGCRSLSPHSILAAANSGHLTTTRRSRITPALLVHSHYGTAVTRRRRITQPQAESLDRLLAAGHHVIDLYILRLVPLRIVNLAR